MSAKGIPNVDIELPEQYTARPVIRPSSGRQRPSSNVKPIKPEPCSQTLGKFHDAVNFSLLIEPHGDKKHVRHPIIDAKEKYKYMSRQKSYVDESLFGSCTPRSRNEMPTQLNNHLTHDYMSNNAPLMFNVRSARSDLGSARSHTSQTNMPQNDLNNRPGSSGQKIFRPWRP